MDITRHGDWGKVQVKRWEGYGKVRAYVTVEGQRKPHQAGYIDLKTGEWVEADATWAGKAFATLQMSVADICQHYGK